MLHIFLVAAHALGPDCGELRNLICSGNNYSQLAPQNSNLNNWRIKSTVTIQIPETSEYQAFRFRMVFIHVISQTIQIPYTGPICAV